ncbi:hypothetical protein [Segatella baroniae]|nr:hypothetical protein [Segatella baroniae]
MRRSLIIIQALDGISNQMKADFSTADLGVIDYLASEYIKK